MDLPRLDALGKYWRETPPVHIQTARIAAFLGIKTKDAEPLASTPQANEQQAQELMGSFPVGNMPKILTREEYLQKKAGEA